MQRPTEAAPEALSAVLDGRPTTLTALARGPLSEMSTKGRGQARDGAVPMVSLSLLHACPCSCPRVVDKASSAVGRFRKHAARSVLHSRQAAKVGGCKAVLVLASKNGRGRRGRSSLESGREKVFRD